MTNTNKLHIGTSGWSYRWREVLYPPELKSADFLSHYATRFNCTEINSSFYHFTMAKTIEKWLAQTPAHFMFAPKLHQEITHKRKFQEIEEPLQKFMSRYQLMGNRLGPVLVQIAGSFRFDNGIAGDFYHTLRELYPEQPFALEARHVSWFTDESFELMRDFKITSVIANAGKRFPGTEVTTTDIAYLRLHGDERLYSSSYSDEKLERYAYMVKDWLEDGKEVWVFLNNTILGNAVLNADRLRQFVTEL
ncbi:DUF72 domain-containing protein [Pontibacter ramchanderi]|uniref:Uncharacterized protein YecE (DUF72 family) n=1 Tax=Pontibacter ramchanderi TaxID=1179743 RepID=A0A2N3U7G0_9BACT|nr:DUF72 domain-containing protein [Pontibacter ramchanderi]PKV62665.1 uncharacterized protein YecE (DUF72 family) [Pontibacter ramchanderi]